MVTEVFMPHRRSAVKGKLSFSHPAVRAWLFQIIAIVAVVVVAIYLIHNTVTNLSNRGITSGFAFLDRSAGFGIVQHLIDYQEGDTYGRVFLVGLLNTLLVDLDPPYPDSFCLYVSVIRRLRYSLGERYPRALCGWFSL